MHAHVIPAEIVALVRAREVPGVRMVGDDVLIEGGGRHPLLPEFHDTEAHLAAMDQQGLNVRVVSLSPGLLAPGLDLRTAADLVAVANDSLARFVAEAPSRLAGLAAVPLVDGDAALAEVRRSLGDLALAGAWIGVGSSLTAPRTPADPMLEPAIEAIAERDAPLFLHPTLRRPPPGLDRWHLGLTCGAPLDVTVAAAGLIHSGTLDRHPRLRVLLAHGGGFLPYQVGRLDRAWRVRAELGAGRGARPSSLIRRFWFDSITHDDGSLAFLASSVGADRIVLGTDTPFDFDMADPEGPRRMRRLGLGGTSSAAARGLCGSRIPRLVEVT